MNHRLPFRVLATAGALLASSFTADSMAQSARALEVRAAQVIEHWTPAARAAAIPRDLVIDERGLGYLRHSNGQLEPYGHDIAAMAGPGGGDTTGPTITSLNPAGGTIGASAAFSANVSDPSGVKTVTANVQQAGGPVQTFTMAAQGGGLYGVTLSGFTDGSWSWWVTAKDTVKGGNSSTSTHVAFTVDTGGSPPPPPPGGAVTSSPWTTGVAKMAIGRIYFEMPANPRKTRWSGYVCSGTVVNDDNTTDRSIILTASHCVYDDANKAFARNVLFIPDQMDTTAAGTDRVCDNDPIGCWAPSYGVVDTNWTTRTFPANVKWDIAFYVVNHTSHAGNAAPSNILDEAVAPMALSLAPATVSLNSLAHALGYSYSEDPKLMYCADLLTNEATDPSADYWLAGCGLTGGSSGGPWAQPFDTSTGATGGNGPIISVNSWGYTNQVGMAGPKMNGASASCVFGNAKTSSITGTNVTAACGP